MVAHTAVVLLLFVGVTAAQMPTFRVCPDIPKPKVPSVPLPELAQQFEVRIQANIINRNYSTEVLEYYDFINNRGANFRTLGGIKTSQFYNFKTYEQFTVTDGNCTTSDLRHGFSFFAYFNQTKGGGHIGRVDDIFRFGDKYNDSYQGEKEVRGIPVDHWSTCLTSNQPNITFTLDYYFTSMNKFKPAWGQAAPVRAVVTGWAQNVKGPHGHIHRGFHNFTHIYEFLFYRNRTFDDDSLFQTPRGVVCPGRKNVKPTPKLSNSYSLDIEVVNRISKSVSLMKYYHDLSAQLSRADFEVRKRKWNKKYFNEFGESDLKFINDYNTGHQYVIDKKTMNCTIQTIDLKGPEAIYDDDHTVHMATAAESWNISHMTYEGTRSFRGIPVDVWIGKNINRRAGNWTKLFDVTTEVYISQENITENMDLRQEKYFPIGMWVQYKNKSKESKKPPMEFYTNIFEYSTQHPGMDVYDITACFDTPGKTIQHLMFKLEGKYMDLVHDNLPNLTQALRQKISEIAGVAQIRIPGVAFDQTNDSTTDAWFTLVDKPKIAGNVHPTAKAVQQNISLALALDNLNKTLKMGFTFKAPIGQGERDVKVMANTLKTDKEVMDPRTSGRIPIYPNPTGSPVMADKGYSAGAMAGVAVAMIVVGTAIGLGIAFVMYKRRMDIPYEVQN